MIPIFLDPAQTRIVLVGRGDALRRRLRWLQARGAEPRVVEANEDVEPRADDADLFVGAAVVWVTGLAAAQSQAVAARAKSAGALVNVEDAPHLCDFHTPAIVQRGKLVLAAGTGGASPAAAAAVREILEGAFTPDWANALENIADARTAQRAAGLTMADIAAETRAMLLARGLLAERVA